MAQYPPPPILENEDVCSGIKSEFRNEDGIITLIGHWGTGKTHFGYRIHYELSNKNITDIERQITTSEFAKNTLSLYVTLGMVREAKPILTFENVIRTGLLSLSQSQVDRLLNKETFGSNNKLINASRNSFSGLENYVDEISPEGIMNATPLGLLKSLAKKYNIDTFVFIIDEIEEIEESRSNRFSPADLDAFIKATKHFVRTPESSSQASVDLDDQIFSIVFLLLVSDAEWTRFKRAILEEGPRARRNIEYSIERPSYEGWHEFIDQRKLPSGLELQEECFSSFWNILGRNYGWFEVIVSLLSHSYKKDPSIMNQDTSVLVESFVTKAAKQGRDLINQVNYQRLLSGLTEKEVSVLKKIFFTGKIWNADDLANELKLERNQLDDLVEKINRQKVRGKVEPLQEFIPISLRISDTQGMSRIDNPEFHDTLESSGGSSLLSSGRAMKSLISTPIELDSLRLIPANSQDFGARLRWLAMGEVDLLDKDADTIHSALSALKQSNGETYIGMSWWWIGELTLAVKSELPASYLPEDKSKKIYDFFENSPPSELKAILRGLLETLKHSDLLDAYTLPEQIGTKPVCAGKVAITESPLSLLLNEKGHLKVKVKLAVTKQVPDIQELEDLSPGDVLTLLLTPSEKELDLPEGWVQISFQELSFLSLLGMSSDTLLGFKYSEEESDLLWSRGGLIDKRKSRLLKERKNRLRGQLNIENVVFMALKELVDSGLCIFPLIPKKQAERNPLIEARSPVSMASRIILNNSLQAFRGSGGFFKVIKEDLVERWTDYSSLVESISGPLISIESPIRSETSRGKENLSINVVRSSITIIEFLKRLTEIGTLEQAIEKIKGKRIVTSVVLREEKTPSTEDVVRTHLQFLLSTGYLIQRKDGQIELMYGNESVFLGEIIRNLKLIVKKITLMENDTNTGSIKQLLNYRRIGSSTYLQPWLDALDQMKKRINEEEMDKEWFSALRCTLPRIAYLFGNADLSDVYGTFLHPLVIKDKIDFEEDITLFSKSSSAAPDIDKPLHLFSSVLGNLAKDLKREKKKPITPKLTALFEAAKLQTQNGVSQINDLRNSLKKISAELEVFGFGESSKVRESLNILDNQLVAAEAKIGGGDVEGFFSDLKSVDTLLSEYARQWKQIENIIVRLKE